MTMFHPWKTPSNCPPTPILHYGLGVGRGYGCAQSLLFQHILRGEGPSILSASGPSEDSTVA